MVFSYSPLEIALRLREQNPTSFFYQRTAAVSLYLTGQGAQAARNKELMTHCLADCFLTLDALARAEVELDPPMRQLHTRLAPLFGGGPVVGR